MGLISNGTTIFDEGALSSGIGGSMVFIKKLTASSSATLSFVDGSSSVVLDNTYKEYLFTFKNIHPATDNVNFGTTIGWISKIFSMDGGYIGVHAKMRLGTHSSAYTSACSACCKNRQIHFFRFLPFFWKIKIFVKNVPKI